jgi:hypothetical protein
MRRLENSDRRTHALPQGAYDRHNAPCKRPMRVMARTGERPVHAPNHETVRQQQPISLIVVGGPEDAWLMLACPKLTGLIGSLAPPAGPCRPGAQCSDQRSLASSMVAASPRIVMTGPCGPGERPREEILPTTTRPVNSSDLPPLYSPAQKSRRPRTHKLWMSLATWCARLLARCLPTC